MLHILDSVLRTVDAEIFEPSCVDITLLGTRVLSGVCTSERVLHVIGRVPVVIFCVSLIQGSNFSVKRLLLDPPFTGIEYQVRTRYTPVDGQ